MGIAIAAKPGDAQMAAETTMTTLSAATHPKSMLRVGTRALSPSQMNTPTAQATITTSHQLRPVPAVSLSPE